MAVVMAALLAPAVAPSDPRSQDVRNLYSPPSLSNLFGTDHFGRDLLSRVLWGARYSLLIGVLSVAVGGSGGVLIGLYFGYSGGWSESAAMRVVDAMMAFPPLILALLVVSVLGASVNAVVLSISVAMVPKFARFAYGQTVSLKGYGYVEAARALGAGRWRIMTRHILPNAFGPITVLATLSIAFCIRLEASLGFLGYGVQPPSPTWGNIIKDGLRVLEQAPWITIIPGAAILLSVLGFNLIGDSLRDALDPELRHTKS